jgi:hypothetical protein
VRLAQQWQHISPCFTKESSLDLISRREENCVWENSYLLFTINKYTIYHIKSVYEGGPQAIFNAFKDAFQMAVIAQNHSSQEYQ